MLVLLIIMMLIAPMLQQGVAVTLPEAGQQVAEARDAESDGCRDRFRQPVLGERYPVLEERASRRGSSPSLEDKTEKIVLIKGDKDAKYSAIMEAMDALRAVGIEDIGLITEPKKDRKHGGGRQVVMAHAHKHFGAEKVVRGETPHASADMNVTPLIDVLLVLLIIFMATLPLLRRGVDINLPLETKTPTQPQDNTQVMLEYTNDRQITINHQPVHAQRARDPAARHLRDPQGQDDVHCGRRRGCATATSSPSSTRPRARASRRSASSPKRCVAAGRRSRAN